MKLNRDKQKASTKKVEDAHPGLWSWYSTLWNAFFRFLLFFFYKITVKSEGAIPASGGVLILAKHQRISDIAIGKIAVTDDSGRHLWCLMKAEMARGPLAPVFIRVGGIPVDRSNPERSKHDLMHARKVLHGGDMLCIFPEQTFYPNKMGRGKTPGFRFIAGKPPEPIGVVCVGFKYTKRKFRRTLVEVGLGPVSYYSSDSDPEIFLDERMREIAELSQMEYPFPRPQGRKARGKAGTAN